MVNLKNIVVTSVGGDVGFNICRISKQKFPAITITGLDVREWHAGRAICQYTRIVPPPSSKDYLDKVRTICDENQAEFLIPISEPELRFFNKNRMRKVSQTTLLYASERAVEVGLDKKTTNDFLEVNGFPAPKTVLSTHLNELSYPLVLKPRSGCGSKFVKIVKSPEEVLRFQIDRELFVLQEYLTSENEEYTCGLFRGTKQETRSIIFRRKLEGGVTGEGVVVRSSEIEKLLDKVAEKLDLVGSINIQLRIQNGIPYIFEINPRFSSTVFFRHLLGFEDYLWTLEDAKGEDLSKYKPPSEGTRFFRVSNEIVLNPSFDFITGSRDELP